MKQNKFTIIVPTRERADTLYWCLKTLVAQDYENLEILVSDNFSQDNTKEVVDSFDDKRIRYINTGKRVEMSLNWEFALNHVTEGYVCFLGDDDGFVIGALDKINEILNYYPYQSAITWNKINYMWGSYSLASSANALCFNYKPEVFLYDMAYRLSSFLSGKIPYDKLITIYESGFVDVTVLHKNKLNGRFFNASSPDIYANVYLSHKIKTYIFAEVPFSFMGVSGHSTGASSFVDKEKKQLSRFISEIKVLPFNPLLGSEIPSQICLSVVDAVLYIHQLENTLTEKLKKSIIKKYLEDCMKENEFSNIEKYTSNVAILTKTAQINNLETFFDSLLEKYSNKHRPQIQTETQFIGEGINMLSHSFSFNALDFGLNNVYDVAVFMSGFLGLSKNSNLNLTYWKNGSSKWINKIQRINYILGRLSQRLFKI